MQKFPLHVCQPPWLLVGSEERWQEVIRQSSVLEVYDREMRNIEADAAAAPVSFGILSSRRPDRFERGRHGEVYGVMRVRPRETLSGLYGLCWDYIYHLEVNELFRRKFPDPNRIQPGEEIRHPYRLVRHNDALCRFESSEPPRIAPLRGDSPPLLVPLHTEKAMPQSLTAYGLACPVTLELEPFEFREIPYDCSAIFVRKSKVTVAATVYPLTCPPAAAGKDVIFELVGTHGAKDKAKVQLQVGELQVGVDSLGVVSVGTPDGPKTEFDLTKNTPIATYHAPALKVVVAEARGAGPTGFRDEFEIGPSVGWNDKGRIEFAVSFKRTVTLYRYNRPCSSLYIAVEAGVEIDPRASLVGHACQPFARRFREILEELEGKEVARWPGLDGPIIRWVVVGGVVVILVFALGKVLAGAAAAAGMAAALTQLVAALRPDVAAQPVLVVPVGK